MRAAAIITSRILSICFCWCAFHCAAVQPPASSSRTSPMASRAIAPAAVSALAASTIAR